MLLLIAFEEKFLAGSHLTEDGMLEKYLDPLSLTVTATARASSPVSSMALFPVYTH